MANTSSMLEHQIVEAARPVRALLADLSPADVPLPFAPGVLDAFIALERLAAAGRVLIAARAAESMAWQRAGCPSAAAWLALRQGTTTGRARADLETSGRLGDLPDTTAEVRAGNLSPDQAGAVAHGASVNPAAERSLLDSALGDSLRHTKEEAARVRAEVEAEVEKIERERRAHRQRSARWWAKDGRWRLYLEGPIGAGALAQQTLENRVGDIFRTRRGGVREGRDQYAYDAVMELLGGVVAGEPPGSAPGRGAPSSSVGSRPTRRREPVKRLMLVRVDLSALINGHTSAGEVCEIPGVGPVSVDEARRMFGDSVLRLITTNRTAVVDVVTPAHQPTAAQQIAKLWTDPKCVVAGCNRTVRLEYEHRTEFSRVRETVLSNIEHMCDVDHAKKTYENWQLVQGVGRRPLVPPDDPRHPDNLPERDNLPARDGPPPPAVPDALRERARRAMAKAKAVPEPGRLFDTG